MHAHHTEKLFVFYVTKPVERSQNTLLIWWILLQNFKKLNGVSIEYVYYMKSCSFILRIIKLWVIDLVFIELWNRGTKVAISTGFNITLWLVGQTHFYDSVTIDYIYICEYMIHCKHIRSTLCHIYIAEV